MREAIAIIILVLILLGLIAIGGPIGATNYVFCDQIGMESLAACQ